MLQLVVEIGITQAMILPIIQLRGPNRDEKLKHVGHLVCIFAKNIEDKYLELIEIGTDGKSSAGSIGKHIEFFCRFRVVSTYR
jgi:hypothetical protein